ncbi:MAG: thymidine kinase [Phototrophicaceae bacterium]|jgi:thymidine kinase
MKHRYGRVEVICGSMFCGKTEELIRRVRRATIAKQTIQLFKPRIDNRYSEELVTSHSGQFEKAEVIDQSKEIIALLQTDTSVVAIDEVQFLDNEIVAVVNYLAGKGLRVILAGLDLDFRAEPFGCMPELMSCAEDVTKLHAICTVCGEDACRTQRLVNGKPASYNDPIVLLGAHESYEARCRLHHIVPDAPNNLIHEDHLAEVQTAN